MTFEETMAQLVRDLERRLTAERQKTRKLRKSRDLWKQRAHYFSARRCRCRSCRERTVAGAC